MRGLVWNERMQACNLAQIACMAAMVLTSCQYSKATQTLLESTDDLTGRQTKSFLLSVPKSGVLKISLSQIALDSRLRVLNADGKLLGVYESGTGRHGDERIALPIRRAGKLLVIVESVQRPELRGHFHLKVELAMEALDAEIAYSDASRIDEMDTPKLPAEQLNRIATFERAGDEFNKALRWHEAGLSHLAAATLNESSNFDPTVTQRLADLATEEFKESKSALLQSESLLFSTGAELEAADFSEKRMSSISRKLDAAQKMYEQNYDELGSAEVESYRGVASLLSNDQDSANQRWKNAFRRCEELSYRVCQAAALQSLGLLKRDSSQYAESLAMLKQALRLFDRSDNLRIFAMINDNIGYSERMNGDYDAALQAHILALQAYAEEGRCSDVSGSLYAIGYALLGIGDLLQATQAYRQVLESDCTGYGMGNSPKKVQLSSSQDDQAAIESVTSLCTATADTQPQTRSMRLNMLWTAWDLGNLARFGGNAVGALTCHRLALSLAHTDNTRLGTRIELVDDLLSMGQISEARIEMKDILGSFSDSTPSGSARDYYRSRALLVSGKIAIASGDLATARLDLQAANKLFRISGDQDGSFASLLALGQSSDSNHIAREHFSKADKLLSAIRTSSLDPAYRASLFAKRRSLYSDWVGAEIPTKKSEGKVPLNDYDLLRTLAIAERSRARVLTDLMSDYERAMESDKNNQEFSLASATQDILDMNGNKPVRVHRQTSNAPSELQHLKREHDQLLLHTSIGNSIASLTLFQSELPSKTAVVEFLVGEQASFVWVLTKKSKSIYRLPPASTINSAVAETMRQISESRADVDLTPSLARLYEIAIRPIEMEIRDMDLIIVADEQLHQVPFSALWNTRTKQYLVEQHVISYMPSINFAIGRRKNSRALNIPQKMLLVGDPVYGRGDALERCNLNTNLAPSTQEKLDASIELPRLIGTAKEVRAIADVVVSVQGNLTELSGCAANRNRFLLEPLSSYSLIHIAAHATVDMVVPQRSAIHLARFDERGRNVASIVTVADLMNSNLSADLVVLSGCTTAGGRIFGGDGSLSLTFSILSAGGTQVLATLWPTADAATTRIMQSFYSKHLENKAPSAHALRKAQLQLIADKRWKSPRYWAAFTVTG